MAAFEPGDTVTFLFHWGNQESISMSVIKTFQRILKKKNDQKPKYKERGCVFYNNDNDQAYLKNLGYSCPEFSVSDDGKITKKEGVIFNPNPRLSKFDKMYTHFIIEPAVIETMLEITSMQ